MYTVVADTFLILNVRVQVALALPILFVVLVLGHGLFKDDLRGSCCRTSGSCPVLPMSTAPALREYQNGKWGDGARRREVTPGKVETAPQKVITPVETHATSEMDVLMEDTRSSPPDLTGRVTIINDFPLASGSSGDIYRGKFNMNGKSTEVAVKVYKMYLQRNESLPGRTNQFHREITVWLKLQHPNVLPFFGTIRDPSMHPDIPAMVCPWVENGALSGYLDRNKDLMVTKRLILVNGVAHGLQYLHAQHVVHGDLSGSNILVCADGGACIADFGLSTLLTAVDGPASATTSQNKGTVRWMAPELFDPDDSHTAPTTQNDVYSFGSIMLQILTGNIPYYRLPRDEQVIVAVVRGIRPDRSNEETVTNSRWNFIERCWSVDRPRPSSDEIVVFTRRELSESMAVEI